MGWFTSPKCSVESDAKNWIEENFQWFIEEFGAEKLKSVEVILPTDEFFPDKYSTRHEDVRKLLDRVCSYMGVNTGRVSLRFFTSEREKWKKLLPHLEFSDEGAAGTYKGWRGKHIVSIESSQLSNPSSVIAIMSHELGHALLIGENRIGGDEEDHEPLTDLLTVYFGLGIFTANNCLNFRQWTDSFSQGWQIGRSGYLTEEMFGYALALFAYVRGEQNPEWSNYLSVNVKTYFKQNSAYLTKTNDTTLQKL